MSDNQPQVGTCGISMIAHHDTARPHERKSGCVDWTPLPQPTPAQPLAIGGIPVRLAPTFAKDEIGIERNGKIVARVKVAAEPRRVELWMREAVKYILYDNRSYADPSSRYEALAQHIADCMPAEPRIETPAEGLDCRHKQFNEECVSCNSGAQPAEASIKQDIHSLREIITPETKQAIDEWRGAEPEERAGDYLLRHPEYSTWQNVAAPGIGGIRFTWPQVVKLMNEWRARAGSSLSLDEKAALLEAKSHSDNFHGVPFDDGFHCGWKARTMPADWGKWENLLTAGERFLEHANSKTDWRNRKFALRKAVQELRASPPSSPGAPQTYKECLVKIRSSILAMAEAPQHDLAHEEYATLALEAQDLSSYLGSVGDSLAVASSPECTAALAKMCERIAGPSSPGAPQEQKLGADEILRLHHKWVTEDDLSHEEVQERLTKALRG